MDIRHSFPNGLLDSIMTSLGRKPYRCRRCERRFYVYVGKPHDEESEDADQPQPQ
jgi:hypothetical protein